MEAIKFFSGTGGSSLYFNAHLEAYKSWSRAWSLGARLACGPAGCAGTIRIYLAVRR